MLDQQHPRAWGDLSFRLLEVDVVGVEPTVDVHRPGARETDGVGDHDVGRERKQHLVARTNTQRLQHGMQSDPTGGKAEAITNPDPLRESLLVGLDRVTLNQLPRIHQVTDRDQAVGERRRPAEQGQVAAPR